MTNVQVDGDLLKDAKPLWILNEIFADGIRRLRHRHGSIQDVPEATRRAAREAILTELTDAAIIELTKRAKTVGAAADQADEKGHKSSVVAKERQRIWASGDLKSPAAAQKFCAEWTVPLRFYMRWPSGAIEVGNEKIGNLEKSGCVPVLHTDRTVLIVGVKSEHAAAFAKRHEIPTCMEWESDGWHCWLLSSSSFARLGKRAASVLGNDTLVSTGDPTLATGKPVYAPLKDARFINGPKKALVKNGTEPPECPEQLVQLILAASGATPEGADLILLK